jgi:hypothetical protein
MKLLIVLVRDHFHSIGENEIAVLVSLLRRRENELVAQAIVAFRLVISKIEEMGAQIKGRFIETLPEMLCRTIIEACDPTHGHCLCELIQFAHDLMTLFTSGLLPPPIGLGKMLTTALQAKSPIIPADELQEICAIILGGIPFDEFENQIIRFIAKTRQKSVLETSQRIARQRIKDALIQSVLSGAPG